MVHKFFATLLVILGLLMSYACWLGAAMSASAGSLWEIVGIPLTLSLLVAASGVAYWAWILRRT